MARSVVVLCSGVLATLLVTGVAVAQSPATPFDAPPARVARGTAAAALLRGNPADLPGIVAEYLRGAGHSDATVASIVLTARDTNARTGVTYLRFTQRVGGLDVYGTYVRASLDASGALTSVIENLVASRAVPPGDLQGGEGRALAIGLQAVHGGAAAPPGLLRQQGNTSVFARSAFFHREPTVTRVAVPAGANGLRIGYLVETWSEQGNRLHHTLVGGDGAVLGIEVRTAADSYAVFTKSPEAGAQQIVQGPAPTSASPNGWLSTGTAQKTTNIVGNNVQAYLDIDANNAPDSGGTAVTNGVFGAAWDGNTQPATTSNRAAATQNLFYLNNVTHDRLYLHGFTETAGNFQQDNFARGGAQGDRVLAEVQDGSGTDNANFATPADGSSPRMQMYIWTGLGNAEVVVGARTYKAQIGSFSAPLSVTGINGPLVLANDGTAPGSDACERFPRSVSLGGRIVIADRGTCDFTVKASNVQRAGGAALIVVNNTDGAIFAMGGTGTSQIPAVMVSSADGTALKSLGNATVRATSVPPINRDSSLDSDIVYHEYGHGLTWRMIGSMSGAMSGAIGEGMSDVLAVLFNNDNDRVGEYAASDPLGIRTEPYENYTRTYKDFGGTEVHLDGEIYGAIGWRLRNNFTAAGLTVETLLDYLVDGMNETQPAPAIEDMRDGILQAIRNTGESLNGPQQCEVWEAFAHYGVGVGAQATTSRRGKLTITESKTLPASCQ